MQAFVQTSETFSEMCILVIQAVGCSSLGKDETELPSV